MSRPAGDNGAHERPRRAPIYHLREASADLPAEARWKGLKRVGMTAVETVRNGKATDAERCYNLGPLCRH